jgi:hypothetical protein
VSEADARVTVAVDTEQAIWALQNILLQRGVCPLHGKNRFEIEFGGRYGAPGVGAEYHCSEGHSWSKVGGEFYRPEDMAQRADSIGRNLMDHDKELFDRIVEHYGEEVIVVYKHPETRYFVTSTRNLPYRTKEILRRVVGRFGQGV